jgi:Protein of unknown function (DUF1656)
VRFTEIDLFGVYVAPMSLMMVAAWLVTIALRRVSARFGLLRYGESASPISILTKAIRPAFRFRHKNPNACSAGSS